MPAAAMKSIRSGGTVPGRSAPGGMIRALTWVVAVMAITVSACSASDTSERSGSSDQVTTTSIPRPRDDPGRMVALGEEELLADLLALDLVPVASTATRPEEGFAGIRPESPAEVEVLDPGDITRADVEAREPDTVVATESAVRYFGLDGEDPEFRLVTVADDLGPDERLMFLAAEFERTERASALVHAFDEIRAEALVLVPDGCRMSVATVTRDGGVLLWAVPLSPIPATIDDLGCEVVAAPPPPTSSRTTTTTTDPTEPRADPHEWLLAHADDLGRVELYLDEPPDEPDSDGDWAHEPTLDLISAPVLLLLQPHSGVTDLGDADAREDHLDSLAEVTDELDGWDDLPAVEEDRVWVLDPAAFPGLAGRTALIRTLSDLVGDADLFEE